MEAHKRVGEISRERFKVVDGKNIVVIEAVLSKNIPLIEVFAGDIFERKPVSV